MQKEVINPHSSTIRSSHKELKATQTLFHTINIETVFCIPSRSNKHIVSVNVFNLSEKRVLNKQKK